MQAVEQIWLYEDSNLDWSLVEVAAATGVPATISDRVEAIAREVVDAAQPGDHIVVISNGAFGGMHELLIDGLQQQG